ncbi:MBL fold metallo-hydrolase [Winogradskyella aurantiaca]|uniref:MBL fold metallo-hydrolase n=1 Tax=Winogradskyella aurantiaca TaxID=2219558 RepID=UPI000E1E0880|nr:MBL fold metallo-hydrolase [Winogradskyella aurantiaca]
MTFRLLSIFLTIICLSCKQSNSNSNSESASLVKVPQDPISIIPISHASLILEAGDNVIYVDPTGGANAYVGHKRPTAVFITDIHGDHMNKKTLEELQLNNIPIIAPPAVIEKLPSTIAKNTFEAKNNFDYILKDGLSFSTIPMYNLREEALKFHPKGRGNGYILNLKGQRIYISGDTEDIPEMRTLKDIDKAFICMNLPYTMTVEKAADAVIDFKPKQVYPYHYRGQGGLSDIGKFRAIVNEGNSDIEVVQLEWYN